MRAIIGLSPEEQDKAVGAAADAEQQYKQAGNAAADQAEAGVDRATQQVLWCRGRVLCSLICKLLPPPIVAQGQLAGHRC